MTARSCLRIVTGLFLFAATALPAATLVATNGVWKWRKGTNEAASPLTAWRPAAFNDGAWTTSAAPFFYSSTPTEPPFYQGGAFTGTTLEDMRNKYSSVFFRRTFTLADPGAARPLTLRAVGDDGFIAWLNGVEVARYNMPSGVRPYNSFASGSLTEPLPIQTLVITNTTMLTTGLNVLAVQAFNATLDSTDFGFFAELSTPADTNAPAITALLPLAGSAIGELTQVVVTFNEAVTEVEAADLLINGEPAAAVTKAGLTYTFTVPEPLPGAIAVAWAADHGIRDLASNPFAGGGWSYSLQPGAFTPSAIISEFMAANVATLADEDAEYSDWIEILNPRLTALNLDGWHLTDDADNLIKWTFPATNLPSGGRLIVFASGKNRTIAGGPLHANFSLSSDGEFLGLVMPDGVTVVSAFAPAFPAQKPGVSYGLIGSTITNGFLAGATPGAANASQPAVFIAETRFSHERGFYQTNFSLALSCATPGALIYFTTNGSAPSGANGALYSTPLPISRTSVIRARAEKPGHLASDVTTHTYLFLRDIVVQSTNGLPPPGWPATWGDHRVDYGMDPRLSVAPPYGLTISNDLRSLPTIALSVRLEDLFSAQSGIYANPSSEGAAWERPCAVELIYPNGTKGFASPAGLRIRGGFSRTTSNPKHSFRLNFRDQYGAAKLKYPMFGPTGVDTFDRFDLRTSQDGSYAFLGDPGGLFLPDPFTRQTALALGLPAERGDWYHLYLNGQYWGLYNSCERPEANFAASYFGGAPEDWDVLKPDPQLGYVMKVTDGNDLAWQRLWRAATNGFASNADYFRVQGCNADGSPNAAYENLVDVTNLVDYLLTIIWVGDYDGPIFGDLNNGFLNNYYAFRERGGGRGGFRFVTHDAELSLQDLNENRAGTSTRGDPNRGDGYNRLNPHYLATRLRANPEFRTLFADRFQKFYADGGPLSTEACTARFEAGTNELFRAITGECARWGDAQRPTSPITPAHWVNAVQSKLANYFPYRGAIVANQLRAQGLWPALAAPSFSPATGEVAFGGPVTFAHTNTGGTIFYTLDGSDPRAIGGGVAPSAIAYSGPISVTGSFAVHARVKDGATWSPLVETSFFPAQTFAGLRVTEIMFHPPMLGSFGGDEYEFLELKNTGTNFLDLGGCQFTGLTFTFTNGTRLPPGAFFVFARNATNFAAKYPGVTVHGLYSGRLDNGGETIALTTAAGAEIFSVTYGDRAPWPVATDGHGFSLVPLDPLGLPSPDDGAKWRASANPGGSPGSDDPPPTVARVVINEIVSRSTAPPGDRIELFNPGTTSVDLGGWWLSDDAGEPRKFRIPEGTVIAGGGFAVFTAAQFGDTNSTTAFALNADGEELYLSSGTPGSTNLTGWSHGVEFGAAASDVSFGRYVNSVGEEYWPAQLTTTFGASNSGPQVGPAVLNEIHYHPLTNEAEYVELLNVTAAPLPLFDPAFPTNTWRVDGLGFRFPTNVTLAPGGFALLVGTDPVTFRARHAVPSEAPTFAFAGALQDSGERLELQRPDAPNTNGNVAFITVDAVRYNDRAPWPAAADGDGPALQRRVATSYGNDPTNWFASGLTPGRPNRVNQLPLVSLITPSPDAVFTLPAMIPLETTVSDPDGTVTLVEFLDGGVKIGEATNAPWRFSWFTASPGGHALTAKARDDELGSAVSAPVTITVNPPAIGSGIGLRGEYFDNQNFTGARVTRLDGSVDFSWPDEPLPGFGADTFSVRWTGRVQPISSGNYTFHIVSANGARLWLDGTNLVNNFADHAQTENTATVALEAGRLYDLRLDFFHSTGPARVQLAWSALGLSRQTIPRAQLYPPANPANQPPTVALTSPGPHSGFAFGSSIPLAVTASDPDGAIWKVRFLTNGALANESSVPPFNTTWGNAPRGTHELRAVAYDDSALAVTSAPVIVHVVSGFTTNETLVPFGATWRYWDRGTLPAADWFASGYSDAGWSNGPAQLGYGDGDEATVVSFGGNSAAKFITTYFRRSFTVTAPENIVELGLRLVRDDGLAVLLNGGEQFRDNLPAGPLAFATLANGFISGADESMAIPGMANPATLVAGANLLAVEVHQGSGDSSDISFDLELTAIRSILAPYVITPPVSVATNVGATVRFTVTAGGWPTLGYHWRLNGTTVVGASNALLTISNAGSAQVGGYTVVVTNALGAVTSAVVTLVLVDLDSDGDALPDVWELANGTDPDVPDANGDPDHDGATSLEEFLAGTSPTNAASVLRLDVLPAGAGAWALRFTAISNRAYGVQQTFALSPTGWMIFTNVPAAPTNRAVILPLTPTPSLRFIRVRTPP